MVTTTTTVCCSEETICQVCSLPVCWEHTPALASCVEVGAHHIDCVPNCPDCARETALDAQADLAEARHRGEW